MAIDLLDILNYNLSPQGDGNKMRRIHPYMKTDYNLSPQKPSQALRASSPEGRAFPAAVTLY